MLPGLAWAKHLFPTHDRLTRWTVGTGLSYVLAMVLGLVLHYLPGPVPFWAELAALNALALIPGLAVRGRERPGPGGSSAWLLVIIILAAFFRFTDLGYSEFQGDEALAMITAAEALEGHQDALFLRGKGPGEVLLPMALWRLTGTINEAVARLPFTIAGLLMVLTTYLLGRRLLSKGDDHVGESAALIAAGLLALSGFMVAFSRIVQYQVLVVWMSGLAMLCAWEWRVGEDTFTRRRWAALSGAFLGAGLLAHYDAILVAPALAYLQIPNFKSQIANRQTDKLTTQQINQPTTQQMTSGESSIATLLTALGSLLIVAGLFYLPYALDPQASRTGEYLGDRIGDALLKNNLGSFLHFSVFYNSSYYVILTGLLVLGLMAWALRRAPGVRYVPGGRYWVPALAAIAAVGLTLWPNALRIADLDLAALPFALILLGAFLSSALDHGQRAVVAWLAVPFIGYNFAVALPFTHIYTTVPAWTLLAALTAAQLWNLIQSRVSRRYASPVQVTKPPTPYTYPTATSGRLAAAPPVDRDGTGGAGSLLPTPYSLLLAACYFLVVILFGGYLYSAYLRHDVELWQDWPDSQPALYWTPYTDLPPAGFFGFSHRTGWKEVGALYAEGILKGDYGSNEEPDVTTWYTRGAPRACDPQPEYYLIADDLVDPWPIDPDIIEAGYADIGRVTLPNGKGSTIYQAHPAAAELGHLQTGILSHNFDRTATPDAFARSARGSQPIGANLGGLARLIGYDIVAQRAWPGGRVSITLYWQAQAATTDDYHVFVHLEGDEEAGSAPGIWGQADGRPVCWTYPTSDWRPGQIIADQHAVTLKPDTPPGDYPLLVGMYLPDTGARLDVLDETGQPVANYIELTTVPVR
jgi:hypothetical protein